jgi:hypothetical protein
MHARTASKYSSSTNRPELAVRCLILTLAEINLTDPTLRTRGRHLCPDDIGSGI